MPFGRSQKHDMVELLIVARSGCARRLRALEHQPRAGSPVAGTRPTAPAEGRHTLSRGLLFHNSPCQALLGCSRRRRTCSCRPRLRAWGFCIGCCRPGAGNEGNVRYWAGQRLPRLAHRRPCIAASAIAGLQNRPGLLGGTTRPPRRRVLSVQRELVSSLRSEGRGGRGLGREDPPVGHGGRASLSIDLPADEADNERRASPRAG